MTEIPGAPRPARPVARRKNKWGLGIVIAPLLAVAGFLVLTAKGWHPSESSYPVQGIDVSHHQGAIDWAALPGQGVHFAYIKATEGGDWVDPDFRQNWAGAGAAGIRRGAYHFFTLCRPGIEQAENVIAAVPRDRSAMPLAVDLEFMGNCSDSPRIENLHAELSAFLDLVEEHYGQDAVLYLTEEFDDEFGISARFDRPLWLRSIVLKPDFGSRPWTIWQASNFRRLHGIEGRVDWNVMRPVAD